ncbi:defense protein 3-like [Aricia agestis]|uniref:defense protein 3-like n=1 Tax=Aricia agestis TaxID=91739 RepID=UPI001C20390B|nr:defense protein 3-like [Aricia agestis]XP_041971923.1 defense protein 3-like [Aricia agestis]
MDGGISQNPDGSGKAWGKLPIASGDNNTLSAIGSLQNSKNGNFHSATGGLALDNAKGHSVSVTGTHIADFGKQATAAGQINLMRNNGHDLSANAFATRTFPNHPAIPTFDKVGGGVDYNYNQKLGASIGVQHVDIAKRTEYSAMASANVFRTPTSSLDVNAGVSKTVSPFGNTWEKSGAFVYKKQF